MCLQPVRKLVVVIYRRWNKAKIAPRAGSATIPPIGPPNEGKARNEVVCAIARKLVTYAWHILRGDPTPNRECEASYRRKLGFFCTRLKLLKEVKKQGYKTIAAFIDAQVEQIYSGLPEFKPANSAS